VQAAFRAPLEVAGETYSGETIYSPAVRGHVGGAERASVTPSHL